MFIFRLFFFFFICIWLNFNVIGQCSTPTHSFDLNSIPREHNIDIVRMKLEVSFVPEKGLVKGSVTHYFSPLREKVDSVFLHGVDLVIHEAKLNGEIIKYRKEKDGFTFFSKKTLTFGESDSLMINYEATPIKGIYFIGWNDSSNLSRKQIWTQGQAEDNRYWIPCYDLANDKLITEVIVHFDSDYKVLSNGHKITEIQHNDKLTTWHYMMNNRHASYLLMLGIGKYDIVETRSKSNIPINLYYYPEWKDRFEPTYKYSKEIFDFLETEIGFPYPWESYSQIPVQDFMYGAMENTTATIFGDFFQVDKSGYNDGNYVSVNAHELAHQWFGDLVTARTISHLWLQESFATHYNLLAEKLCFGLDHFDWARRSAMNSALAVSDKKPLSMSNIPTELIYQKGSQVLEMLKYVIGRESFNQGVKRYLIDHQYGNVDSKDLLDAFHDELGLTLNWFWDQWIYRGGEPSYHVEYKDLVDRNKNRFTEFIVSQSNELNSEYFLFKMPIEFQVFYTDGTSDKSKEWINEQRNVVRVPNPNNKKIDFVLFDPNNRVLKKVYFNKSFNELVSQAKNAPNLLDRYDALVELNNYPLDKKRNILKEIYDSNTFFAIKSEVISQVLEDSLVSSLDLIARSLTDEDIKLRKEVVKKTNRINQDHKNIYKELLKDSSYYLVANTLDLLCENFPENTLEYLDITKKTKGIKGLNVRMKWLRIAFAYTKDSIYLNEIINYSSNSYEFLTRLNSFSVLRRINICTNRVIKNCIDASFNNNIKLSTGAIQTLKFFYSIEDNKKLILSEFQKFYKIEKYKTLLSKIIV